MMTTGNIITIALFMIANGIVIAVTWGKITTKLQQVETDQKEAVNKFEEAVKDLIAHTEKTYQRKDMCELAKNDFAAKLSEITRLDLSARFTKLETQLTQVQAGIEELKRR